MTHHCFEPGLNIGLHIGSMIYKAGAGPEPIPHKKLNVDNLRDAIKFATSPTAKIAAQRMAEQIEDEVSLQRTLLAPSVLNLDFEEWAPTRRRFIL